ncbi:MAG TPA: DUF3667 domain-containing protein [Rhizomicrobium sp.]|nr:DUF3667 domain-containing protein [Rhizomicrobium sp.]
MMDELGAIGETAGAVAVEMAVAALLERGGKVGPCTNCGSPMMGAYCGVCGQPVDTHRRSVFVLLHDFVKDVASFDSRILRTGRALLFQPGELPAAFRDGRTQRYVPAVRLYLFVSLIFFLALSFFGIAIMQLTLTHTTQQYTADKNHNVFVINNGVKTRMEGFRTDDKGNVFFTAAGLSPKRVPNIKVNGDKSMMIATQPHFFTRIGTLKSEANNVALAEALKELGKAKNEKSGGFAVWLNDHVQRMFRALAADPASINGPLTEWIPRALIILLPLFALLLALFYWRQRKTYYFVDHLVFSLNFHTFGFVVLLMAAGLAQILPTQIVAGGLVLWLAAYLLLGMKRFYGQNWFWTSAKFASVGFIYFAFFLIPALGLIILASILRM